MGAMSHTHQMNVLSILRCYRCNAVATQIDEAPPLRQGEKTVQLACPRCGQRYEMHFTITSAIYAVAADGEAIEQLEQCDNCHLCYPTDEPHVCEVSDDSLMRLYTLGQLRLEYKTEQQRWRSIPDIVIVEYQQALPLLHSLISSPGRKLGREQAIQTLWPDLDAEMASHQLNRAVHSLRLLFDLAHQPVDSSLLLTKQQTLLLADQSQVGIDTDAFESLLSQARANKDPGQAEQLLEEAMLLYGGDYLPKERTLLVVQARRESLHRQWVGLMLELADLRIAREALPSAIDTLDRLLTVDPINEAAIQRLMLSLTRVGRQVEARVIYERFAATLDREYKIKPLQETRALLTGRNS